MAPGLLVLVVVLHQLKTSPTSPAEGVAGTGVLWGDVWRRAAGRDARAGHLHTNWLGDGRCHNTGAAIEHHRSVIVQCVAAFHSTCPGVRGEGVFLRADHQAQDKSSESPDKSQYHSQYKLSFGQRSSERPPTATPKTIWKLLLDIMRH